MRFSKEVSVVGIRLFAPTQLFRPTRPGAAIAILVFTLTFIGALSLGCSKGVRTASAAETAPIAPTLPANVEPARPSLLPPVCIFLGVAKTLSDTHTSSETLAETHVIEPVRAVRERGGELIVGIVSAESDEPFARLHVDPPPIEPGPPPPDPKRDVFADADLAADYAAKLRAHEVLAGRWERETAERIQIFYRDLAPILNHPANAKRSDFYSCLDRGRVALEEPHVGWALHPTTIVLIIGDGGENVHRIPRPTFPSGSVVAIVNGIGVVGELGYLRPTVFSSIDGAIRFVLASGGRS